MLSFVLLCGTAVLPQQQPTQDAAASLVASARLTAQTIDALPRKIVQLEKGYADYVTALRNVQPRADEFFIQNPWILAAPDDSDGYDPLRSPVDSGAIAKLQIPGPKLPAAQLETLSRVLWNPEPLRAQWLAIRGRNDLVDFRANIEKARALAEKRKKYDEIESDWRDMAERVRMDKTKRGELESLTRELNNELTPLAEWARTMESTIVGDLRVVEGIKEAVLAREKAVSAFQERKLESLVVWHEELSREIGMNERHRYAMKERTSVFEQDLAWLDWWIPSAPAGPLQGWGSTKFTWPICKELFQAAKDFDFWYRWATDETWYAGSDRRLDPATWPKEAPKTRALHEEFAQVVTWRHYVFEPTDRAPHDTSPSAIPSAVRTTEQWNERVVATIGQQYESWHGQDAKLMNHLSLYFAPPIHAQNLHESTGQRIPSGTDTRPGQVLPPLPQGAAATTGGGRDDAPTDGPVAADFRTYTALRTSAQALATLRQQLANKPEDPETKSRITAEEQKVAATCEKLVALLAGADSQPANAPTNYPKDFRMIVVDYREANPGRAFVADFCEVLPHPYTEWLRALDKERRGKKGDGYRWLDYRLDLFAYEAELWDAHISSGSDFISLLKQLQRRPAWLLAALRTIAKRRGHDMAAAIYVSVPAGKLQDELLDLFK